MVAFEIPPKARSLPRGVQILTAYEGTMEGKPEPATTEAYEHSEMLLYKVQVLLEGGSYAAAMALLDGVKVCCRWIRRVTCC